MKKLILTILLCFTLIPLWNKTANSYIQTNSKQYKYAIARLHYPWLNKEIYSSIRYYCNYWKDIYKLDEYAVCALIKEESGSFCNDNLGKMEKVVSRSGAIGIMQVMPFHSPKNPNRLKQYDFNIKKGTWYFAKCMKKSKGNIKEASRMYNAGLYNKRWKYKNWAYVNRITSNYNSFNKEVNKYKNVYAIN